MQNHFSWFHCIISFLLWKLQHAKKYIEKWVVINPVLAKEFYRTGQVDSIVFEVRLKLNCLTVYKDHLTKIYFNYITSVLISKGAAKVASYSDFVFTIVGVPH